MLNIALSNIQKTTNRFSMGVNIWKTFLSSCGDKRKVRIIRYVSNGVGYAHTFPWAMDRFWIQIYNTMAQRAGINSDDLVRTLGSIGEWFVRNMFKTTTSDYPPHVDMPRKVRKAPSQRGRRKFYILGRGRCGLAFVVINHHYTTSNARLSNALYRTEQRPTRDPSP